MRFTGKKAEKAKFPTHIENGNPVLNVTPEAEVSSGIYNATETFLNPTHAIHIWVRICQEITLKQVLLVNKMHVTAVQVCQNVE